MIDFDNDLDTAQVNRRVVTKSKQAEVTTVTETVRVAPLSQASGFKTKSVAEWNWSDLRDYIIGEVERVHGPQVRDAKKEAGIVKGFISRHGIVKAEGIARCAFEVHGGWWRNAPITITRFAKGCDPYFADVISANL